LGFLGFEGINRLERRKRESGGGTKSHGAGAVNSGFLEKNGMRTVVEGASIEGAELETAKRILFHSIPWFCASLEPIVLKV
jgi:hypothetical protein